MAIHFRIIHLKSYIFLTINYVGTKKKKLIYKSIKDEFVRIDFINKIRIRLYKNEANAWVHMEK